MALRAYARVYVYARVLVSPNIYMHAYMREMEGRPVCGQAVGCGVCDTPELWRGAAGLCVRVRGACAGAAESLQAHTYMEGRLWGGGAPVDRPVAHH